MISLQLKNVKMLQYSAGIFIILFLNSVSDVADKLIIKLIIYFKHVEFCRPTLVKLQDRDGV